MNVLVCAMNSPGFVYQAIGLAKRLEAAGHRVACVSSASVAPAFAAHGIERIPRPGSDGGSFLLTRWSALEATLLQLLHVEHAARLVHPDVIVASPLGFGPSLAAERLGLPLAIIGGLTFLWEPGTWRHEECWSAYAAARARVGLASLPAAASTAYAPWLGDVYLLQSAPSLTGPSRWPQCRWVGDASWDPPTVDAELVAWLDAAAARGRRIVYVQPGREFGRASMLEMLDEPARRLGLAFAVATAHADHESSRTEEWLWARPFVPRAAVLSRCEVVVTSGQPTAVLGALVHGRPLVLLWSGSGTEDAAQVCGRRGVALTERLEDASPERLTALLSRALADDAMRAAAAEVGRELSACGGLDAVADAVLEISPPAPPPGTRTYPPSARSSA